MRGRVGGRARAQGTQTGPVLKLYTYGKRDQHKMRKRKRGMRASRSSAQCIGSQHVHRYGKYQVKPSTAQ
eukprot:5643810-Pleurochrysis_carterae.AAC.1